MGIRFASREAAAWQLAAALSKCKAMDPLVLGIPRGGVAMAAVVAAELQGDLDVVLVRKLGAAHNPEFAVGAVDESGWTYVSPQAKTAGTDAAWLEEQRREQLALLRERRRRYTPARRAADPAGRVVIVVDDGLATGASMFAALHAVRARHPARLICAVPVAPPATLEQMASHADEVVCLQAPENFYAVGQFYDDFRQVDDDEVVRMLVDANKPDAAP